MVTVSSSASVGISSSSQSASSAFGIAVRPTNSSCLAPAVVDAGTLSIQWPAAFPSLSKLSAPVGLLQLPGSDDEWYVLNQDGIIHRFANQVSVVTLSVALDIRDRVSNPGNETGLLSAVAHPNFSSNRYVFLFYTGANASAGLESRVARYKVKSDGAIDKNSELILLRIDRPYHNHIGGQLAFGHDGYLYIASGDGGSGGDPHEYGQNKNVLLGKILRIDINKTSQGLNYAIPADNPFVGSSSNTRAEIWAYGLRNPWRFSFDKLTGELLAGDVGQGEWEEINRIERGGNYGWGDMEGDGCYSGRPGCSTANKIKPVHSISHATGVCSVIGGYIYRGSAFPSVYGKYFFTDYCVSKMQAISFASNNTITVSQYGSVPAQIVSFAQDNHGELYAIGQSDTAGKQIFKMQVSGGVQPGVMASRLSATGCVDAAAPKQPAAGLIPYGVANPLWSDDAAKQRYLALSDTGKIDLDADGDFDMPVGSVLVKHFFFDNKFIETRLFAHGELGWQGFSYEWLDDQSDAVLLAEGKNKVIGSVNWRYPSRDQCMICHTRAANFALGLEVLQLNNTLQYPATAIAANQLATLRHINVFSNPSVSQTTASLVALGDTQASLEVRARSYMHSNCSNCHRPGGIANSNLDLRFNTAFTKTNTCNRAPAAGDLGIVNGMVIAPGEPLRSVLLARIKARGENQMPPLASSQVDAQAVQVIGDWIASLPSCD